METVENPTTIKQTYVNYTKVGELTEGMNTLSDGVTDLTGEVRAAVKKIDEIDTRLTIEHSRFEDEKERSIETDDKLADRIGVLASCIKSIYKEESLLSDDIEEVDDKVESVRNLAISALIIGVVATILCSANIFIMYFYLM